MPQLFVYQKFICLNSIKNHIPQLFYIFNIQNFSNQTFLHTTFSTTKKEPKKFYTNTYHIITSTNPKTKQTIHNNQTNQSIKSPLKHYKKQNRDHTAQMPHNG
jgi:hypothetical protein